MNRKQIVFSLVISSTLTTILFSCSYSTTQRESPQVITTDRTSVVNAQSNKNTLSDQKFIEMMIPHHQGAIDMAEIALKRAKRPEIKKLAQSIIADQKREIQQMRNWYKKWYGKAVPALSSQEMHMDHSMHHGMGGMDMQTLKTTSNFDKEFIQQMIPHHEGAVMMSQRVIDSAEHPEIQNLAKSIIQSQEAEIKQMRAWQQAWAK